MRSFSQIPVHTKFFIATQDNLQTLTGPTSYDDPAIVFPSGYPGPQIINGLIGSVTIITFPKGTLMKDLGRSTTIVDADGKHLAVYREVQRVNSSDTEGVGSAGIGEDIYGTFFVKVWSANSNGSVLVARLG